MKNKEKRLSRRFLGKTEGFKDKQERNFETTHLRAYLKGSTKFRFGFFSLELPGGSVQRLPKYHDVKQEYYLV